jgi:glutathione S-transferase
MRKQEFVLNELTSLAEDLTAFVWNQKANQDIESANREARKRADPTLGPPAIYDSRSLRAELDFFLDRLTSVKNYLFGDSSNVADTTRFLSELARKLSA